METTKTCRQCGQTKPAADFPLMNARNGRRKNAKRSNFCQPCVTSYARPQYVGKDKNDA